MTSVEPAFPLQPHSGVEVIQFLQGSPWTALKSVVKVFCANIEPTKHQCGSDFRSYRLQKHFKFEVKLLETLYFVMDFIFFHFFFPLSNQEKHYSQEIVWKNVFLPTLNLNCLTRLKTQACTQTKFCWYMAAGTMFSTASFDWRSNLGFNCSPIN